MAFICTLPGSQPWFLEVSEALRSCNPSREKRKKKLMGGNILRNGWYSEMLFFSTSLFLSSIEVQGNIPQPIRKLHSHTSAHFHYYSILIKQLTVWTTT